MSEVVPKRQRLAEIWRQDRVPVVLRRGGKGELIRVRLPHDRENRSWLRNARPRAPSWSDELQCWELPKAWFNDLVDRGLQRYGAIYVIQPYREQEKCAPACLNARGHECQCSCMGANHGAGNDGSWFEVTETFATRWNGRELASRLITAR